MSSPAGLDAFLPSGYVPKSGVALSYNGQYAVSCIPGGRALLEYAEDNIDPIELVPGDSVGFYGKDKDLVAIADAGTLRILHLHRMEVIAKIPIRPGSLFVPPSSNSSHIGVVSPGGVAFLIDDDGKPHPTSLKAGQQYNVLWSSSARPIGYSWTDDELAFLYIRSEGDDTGATVSSAEGMVLFTVWTNHALRRHEAYISTWDKPHVLKRVYSDKGQAVVEDLVALPKGATIHDLITLSDGRPAVLSGLINGQAISEFVPPVSQVSELVSDMIVSPSSRNWVEVTGASSMMIWSQTPVTPEYPMTMNYGVVGHPTYHLVREIGAKPNQAPEIPETNTVYNIQTVDGALVSYRYVSPFLDTGYLADVALVIVDDEGLVSSGRFSPTVKLCYDQYIPVAVVPVVHKNPVSAQVADLTVDLSDVINDIRQRRLAREIVVMASGEMCQAAVKAWQNKKNGIRNVILVSPDNVSLANRKARKSNSVIAVNDEEIEGWETLVISDELGPKEVIAECVR